MNKAYMPFSFLIFVPCLARWNDSLEFAVKASIRKKKGKPPKPCPGASCGQPGTSQGRTAGIRAPINHQEAAKPPWLGLSIVQ